MGGGLIFAVGFAGSIGITVRMICILDENKEPKFIKNLGKNIKQFHEDIIRPDSEHEKLEREEQQKNKNAKKS